MSVVLWVCGWVWKRLCGSVSMCECGCMGLCVSVQVIMYDCVSVCQCIFVDVIVHEYRDVVIMMLCCLMVRRPQRSPL